MAAKKKAKTVRAELMVTHRTDEHGNLRLMARCDGWVMVRRPHCIPFVMPVSDWIKLPEAQ